MIATLHNSKCGRGRSHILNLLFCFEQKTADRGRLPESTGEHRRAQETTGDNGRQREATEASSRAQILAAPMEPRSLTSPLGPQSYACLANYNSRNFIITDGLEHTVRLYLHYTNSPCRHYDLRHFGLAFGTHATSFAPLLTHIRSRGRMSIFVHSAEPCEN